MDGESKMPAPDDIVDALSLYGFDAESLRDHALRSPERIRTPTTAAKADGVAPAHH